MKKRGKGKLYLLLAGIAFIAFGGYKVYTSQSFEKESPKIEISSEIYWNLKSPLKIEITDNTGIKSYKVIMIDGKNRVAIDQQKLSNPQKRVEVKVLPPVDLDLSKKNIQIIIEATDKSYWNYFLGNSAQKRVTVHIDTKKPELFVVNNSYAITKGGSALVVFYAQDENMKKFAIATNFGKEFQAEPFYKEGYYIALIAWPLTKGRFRADIVAIDKAGNKARAHIPLYLKDKKYKSSKINLTDKFLNGKIRDLAEDFPKTKSMNKIDRFRFINEALRQMNEKLIHMLTSKVPDNKIDSFDIKPFYPLKNGAKVASFGDHRYYYYQGKFISESYHLGLDLASTKMAPIMASNPGRVVFADYNGIYGMMPIISHGLGLYTLYGHCSSLFVRKGDEVARSQVIAKTGRTGLALGDHLHFGVLVQGVEVRPEEWMDKNWIKLNVKDVITEAKKLIDQR